MRLGRRLLALSLNLLLLQASWTGSRGVCASVAEPAHESHAMAMPAAAPAPSAASELTDAADHGCTGEMLGADCGLMAGCAVTSLMGAAAFPATSVTSTAAIVAFARTSISTAAPQPEPPPPRA
jgi:hypothetical protein